MRIAPVFIALALLAAPALAQTYRWVDANGRAQYSDRPPAQSSGVEVVRPRAGAVGSAAKAAPAPDAAKSPAQPMSMAEKDQAFRKRQIESKEAAEKQARLEAEGKRKTEACERFRGHLASLESGGRHVRVAADGERVYLDDAQIEAEKQRARQDIAQTCN